MIDGDGGDSNCGNGKRREKSRTDKRGAGWLAKSRPLIRRQWRPHLTPLGRSVALGPLDVCPIRAKKGKKVPAFVMWSLAENQRERERERETERVRAGGVDL